KRGNRICYAVAADRDSYLAANQSVRCDLGIGGSEVQILQSLKLLLLQCVRVEGRNSDRHVLNEFAARPLRRCNDDVSSLPRFSLHYSIGGLASLTLCIGGGHGLCTAKNSQRSANEKKTFDINLAHA